MSTPASSARRPSRVAATAQSIGLLLATIVVSALAGLLLAGLFSPGIYLGAKAGQDGMDLFDSLPAELEVQPLNQSSRIEAADGSLLATFFSQNRINVELDSISPYLQHAVIATEDRRFYEHGGIDPAGIVRAALTNATSSNTQGGSTLTQQYVKNSLLMDAVQRNDQDAIKEATEQTLGRKLREAKLAISTEKKMSKDEVLNAYLNVAQFGPSQYGVETASRHYFSKSAKDLTVADSALLAGITNAPNYYDPVAHPERAQKRRDRVLDLMLSQGYIDQKQHDDAKNTPVGDQLKVSNEVPGCASAGGSGFFCDYVTRALLNDPSFGKTAADRKQKLYGGGLTIRTTLDPQTQQVAMDILNRKLPADNEAGFAHTIVTVEPGSGKILTMAEDRTFNPYPDPKPGETAVNYNAESKYGGGAGFEVGSTFKPVVLTQWLKSGHALMEKVPAPERQTYTRFSAKGCTDSGVYRDNWTVRNSVSVALAANITALDATKFSVNTAYAEMTQRLDLCDINQTAKDLGLKLGTEASNGSQDLSPMPSASLGAYNIAPLDMAAAYAAFAADGKYCKPRAIESIKDSNGKDVAFTGEECSQVLDTSVAQAVSYNLKLDLEDPRATGKGRIIPGHDAGGKTGTGQYQYHTWYVGFTKQMATAVWFGNPDKNVRPGGFSVDGEYLQTGHVWGYTVSLETWHEYMVDAHNVKGLPDAPFAQPSSKVLNGGSDTASDSGVPDVTGLPEDDARSQLEDEGYQVETGPTIDADDPEGTVVSTNPAAGADAQNGATVTLTLSNGSGAKAEDPEDSDDQGDGDTGEGV